jgi:hypothetical protein
MSFTILRAYTKAVRLGPIIAVAFGITLQDLDVSDEP